MDRVIKKNSWSWQRITIIALCASLLIFIVSRLIGSAGSSRLNVSAERLMIDTVSQGIFQEFIPITGVVEPIKTVFLDAVEGGRVEEIFVEDGAMVESGAMILRLSNPDLQLNYLNQEANIVAQINQIRNTSILMEQQSLNLKEQALNVQFELDVLDKRIARNKELYASNVIPKVEWEETEDRYEHLKRREVLLGKTIKKDSMFQDLQQDQMNASLRLMKANLKIARANLDNLEVKAPISGQISGLDKEVGELIQEGENIAQIDNLTSFKVRGRVDEFYVSRVTKGQAGSFVQGGKTYTLEIRRIYPEVSNGVFEVDMVFTSEIPAAIRRGQSLSIKLELSGESQALLLSKGSFYQHTGGNWVYVLDPETGNAYKRDIQIGLHNPSYYEIKDGLYEGDQVIISNYANFGDKDELVLQ